MEYVVWFDQISSDMLQLVGGKALHLGEMISLKLPVPFGFVINTKAFEKFLESNKIKAAIQEMVNKCDVENTQQLLETSKAIKELIISKDIPMPIKSQISESYKNLSYSNQIMNEQMMRIISAGREMALVAVRSSATAEDLPTASFAGQQATFLNIKGMKDLMSAVKNCWASLYEPRAIFYRARQGVENASIAVVVQKMVSTVEKSGVMFTANPVSGSDEIVIEATWGLGEMLVSGSVQPDNYRVSKSGEILEKTIGRKERRKIRDYATDRTVEVSVPKNLVDAQALTDDEILRVASLGLKLEENYKSPQDIEFAIDKNKIYLIQTRPITTHAKQTEESKISGEPILKGLGSSPGIATGKVKIIQSMEDLSKIEDGDILVTRMTSPDMVVSMHKCSAIITDEGGTTAHASIVSRELGIPAIVGTKNATETLKDNQIVTVDAYQGFVYAGDVEVKEPEHAHEEESVAIDTSTVTQVKVNLAFPDNLEEVSQKADGVGLLRIEHLVTKFGIHPSKLLKEGRNEDYMNILLDGIRPIAEAFKPKPVWVRTLDARTDEFRNLDGGENEPQEANPMLGWHGIRRSLDEPELLKVEFEAIKKLHEEGLTNTHIMLPFVISVDEFRKAREIAREIELPDTVKIGIMVETPAAALTIEDFCKAGIDFASIGSNDLTQGVLEVDRGNTSLSHLYSESHPAVLKLMERIIKICNKHDIESSICGESGSDPKMAEILVRCGIRSISANIDAMDKIRFAVSNTERQILKEVLRRN